MASEILLLSKDRSNSGTNFLGRQIACCDLVEQRLKRVEVVAIDNGYVDFCVSQFVGDIEAGKPGSDHYYLFFHSFIMFAACAYLGASAR